MVSFVAYPRRTLVETPASSSSIDESLSYAAMMCRQIVLSSVSREILRRDSPSSDAKLVGITWQLTECGICPRTSSKLPLDAIPGAQSAPQQRWKEAFQCVQDVSLCDSYQCMSPCCTKRLQGLMIFDLAMEHLFRARAARLEHSYSRYLQDRDIRAQ